MAITPRNLKNGKAVFDVRVQYGGHRVARTVPTTMTDAKRVEAKMLNSLLSDRFEILKNKSDPTFRTYAQEYKAEVTWHKSYKMTVRHVDLLVKVFGDKRLTAISSKDFLRYRAERIKKVSNATSNREYSCLKRMLNVAIGSPDYKITENPLQVISKLPEAPVENRELEPWEYHKLLEAAPEYFRRIVYFACNVGTREQETLALQFKQIKLRDIGSEIEFVDTKSGQREMVPIHQGVIDLVLEIGQERGINLRRMSREAKEHYVFLGTRGTRLKDVRKPMKRTFDAAEAEYRDFHTFRHFWTTEMFNAGVDVSKIQKIGRWRDLRTMLRYCHPRKPQEFDAVNKLHEHLNQASRGNMVAMKPKSNKRAVSII